VPVKEAPFGELSRARAQQFAGDGAPQTCHKGEETCAGLFSSGSLNIGQPFTILQRREIARTMRAAPENWRFSCQHSLAGKDCLL